MAERARLRVALDLAAGLLGVAVGLLLLVNATLGLPTVAGVAVPVVAMGLVGAGFSAVGVGHVYIEENVRGAGEFLAGVGAMLLGLSFGVTPSTPPFVIGVLALVLGGLVLVAEGL